MKLLDFTINLAKKAGQIILKEAKKIIIEEKRKNDLVTNADKASEKFLTQSILKKFPDHAVLAEEADFAHKSEIKKLIKSPYIWIIDPLDGTTNFAHGLPIYSISIALFKTKTSEKSQNFQYLSGEIILGVIYAPALNELFYAQKGKGTFLNGKKISVSKTQKVSSSLAVTGFPYVHKEMNLPYFTTMMKHAQAIRRLGSAALDLAYIASGRFDLYWEFGLKPWDIAAGSLIVEEAGGRVTDTNGNLLDLFGADLLATNGQVHQETIKIFEKV